MIKKSKKQSEKIQIWVKREKLEYEKELRELDNMEVQVQTTKPVEIQKEKKKILKLTFKEKIALEKLPLEIETLEEKMQEKNNCLADPSCYEEIGITALAKELSDLEELYEQKVEELLDIEEKQETIDKQ
jgi:ATP-binding cassette subfamily F protein uup